ncbi:MAG: hypothetical protein HYR94_18335 [Chloroflexi bacterium]|nr:hypothetical protein [Chloroflexota bacterium]
MKLLDRIARSNGNPHRTVMALRLLNQCLLHELSQHRANLINLELSSEDLTGYFNQSESQQKEVPLTPHRIGRT